MNPTDYEKIKARIEKSNMAPDKKKAALTKLYYFTKVPNFMDAKSVITYLQYRYGNF